MFWKLNIRTEIKTEIEPLFYILYIRQGPARNKTISIILAEKNVV